MTDLFKRPEMLARLNEFCLMSNGGNIPDPDQTDAVLKSGADACRAPNCDLTDAPLKKGIPRIAVIGDYCLDKYLYRLTELDEISVETGLVAWQIRDKKLFAGVGGTIASNLQALGAQTYCFGLLGDDGEGYDLKKALMKTGANIDGMTVSDRIFTGTYMKPMRRENDDWVEMNRLDIRSGDKIPVCLTDEVLRRFEERLPELDAVIVTDQFPPESGSIFTDELRCRLSEIARKHPEIFFFCDSRFFVEDYWNMMVKCNANEMLDYWAGSLGKKQKATTLGNEAELKMDLLARAGESLVRRNGHPVLVTRGAFGSLLFEHVNEEIRMTEIPAQKTEPPIDICGAGDATNAGLTFARSLGMSLAQAALLAGIVSSITIKQIGVTGTASVPEIMKVLSKGEKNG